MTIFKRNRIYHYRFMYKKKIYTGTCNTTNKKLAEDIERKARIKLVEESHFGITHKDEITLSKCFEIYKNDLKERNYNTSVPYYLNTIEKIMGNPIISNITNIDLENLLIKLKDKKHYNTDNKIKPRTINHHFAYLRQAINLCKKRGYKTPDINYPQIKVPKKQIRILNIQEEHKLLEHLKASAQKSYKYHSIFFIDQHDFIIFLLDTGCRYSEASQMKWESINLENGTIRLWRNKTQNETTLVMTKRLHDVLERRIETKQNEYIFTGQNGKGHRKYSTNSLIKAFKECGLEGITPHTLRHTAASKLIRGGLTLYETSIIMGHSNSRMTELYAHLCQDTITNKAANILNSYQGVDL